MKKEKKFTEKGISSEVLTRMLPDHKTDDAKWAQGKTFGFVFHPGDRFVEVPDEIQNDPNQLRKRHLSVKTFSSSDGSFICKLFL